MEVIIAVIVFMIAYYGIPLLATLTSWLFSLYPRRK